MILKKYLACSLLIIGIAACNNNSADPEFNALSSKPMTDTIKDTSQNVPLINPHEQNQPQLTTPVASNATTSSSNLNPEHGQPGHRCDLAVGAPLNSKPVAITQQIQPVPNNKPQTVTTNIPQPATTKTTTAPGMNPPHGEPGHRCDISVGTPLSQPVKNASTVSPVIKDSAKK